MLQWDRTSFDKGYRKVFHIVPAGSTAFSDLVLKYGSSNVFIASSTAAQVAFNAAIGQCIGGANDLIRVYPGTYVLAATISVSKGVVIESASGNARDVIIDCATSDVNGFTLGAAADYSQIRNISISLPDTTNLTGIVVPSSCPGAVVDGVVFTGDDAAAQIGVSNASAGVVVRNCQFYLTRYGVKSSAGSYGVVENCFFQTSNATAAIGVEFMAGDYHRISKNTFNGSHANDLPIKLGTTTLCTLCSIEDNKFHAAQAVLVTNVNTSTFAAFGNYTSGVTGTFVVDAT